MLLSLLADRLVLSPSRDDLFPYGKTRHFVPWHGGQIEVWRERTAGAGSNSYLDRGRDLADPDEPACFILKFNGKAARAERSCLDPLDQWSDVPGEIWSVNPPGYGGSSGKASLRALAPAAEAVFAELVEVAAGRPIFIAANSLGTLSALYLAARHAVTGAIAGLILRNPPPLKELIAGKYAWRSLGLSRYVAREVPSELDAVANAAAATVPAVFLMSGRDTMVPPKYQRLIFRAYAGPRRRVLLPKAGHNVRFSRHERHEYALGVNWLRRQSLDLAKSESYSSLA
jgi:uncharacterized protein